MTKKMSTSEQQISSARGMFEAMRHQRDKAQAGLDAAQAEIRRQRDRADRAEAAVRLERATLAEAWDEGYDEGAGGEYHELGYNPYRSGATA